ncbi:hypothetical protein V6U90_28975 [Micromonospora sp. CPCC 206060]|uniref:hypothetical protein n=1 Tax=Micromonospora sp. CPCC 206060 TaxID=3122406 RepID=UPI002FF259F2
MLQTEVLGRAGFTSEQWVVQQARNLTMDLNEQNGAWRFLIRDRDGKCALRSAAVALSGTRVPAEASSDPDPERASPA